MWLRLLKVGVVLLSCGLFSCKEAPADRLQGRWEGERLENFPPSQAERAAGWVTGTSFAFQGRRATVSIPAESPRRGTFEIAEAKVNSLRVRFLRPHGVKDEVAFAFEGKDQLRWQLGDGRSIVLRKVDD